MIKLNMIKFVCFFRLTKLETCNLLTDHYVANLLTVNNPNYYYYISYV